LRRRLGRRRIATGGNRASSLGRSPVHWLVRPRPPQSASQVNLHLAGRATLKRWTAGGQQTDGSSAAPDPRAQVMCVVATKMAVHA
jgi:hypothetical protein